MTEAHRNNARRLADLLIQIRALPADARDFALFERRDELARLGLKSEDIDAFDAGDNAALDREISALGGLAEDDDATSVHSERPPFAGLVGGLQNFAQKLQQPEVDGFQQKRLENTPVWRGKPVAYENLPESYDYSALNGQFSKSAKEGQGLHREIFHSIKQRQSGQFRMADRTVGSGTTGKAPAMFYPEVLGGHHNHPNTQIDPRTNKPFVGGAVSGGDARNLIASGASFTIAQDGDDQTMFVRTDLTPDLDDEQQKGLSGDQEQRAQKYYSDGLSWRDATLRSAKETAARYGLGFYEGKGGVFKRVPTGK